MPPSTKFCSFGDARSWTNPVTNATLFSPIDFYYQFKNIVAGRLPLDYLSLFLHECTHHWSFHTPVGTALSLLYLRASRSARRILMGEGGSRDAVVSDLTKFEVTSELIRPIIEGIALFAEFDATPGNSPQLSPLMGWAYRLFGPLAVSPKSGFEAINSLLEQARLRDKTLNRKLNLLLQPLDSPEARAYVLGYMSVKNMWNEGIKRSPRLFDRDLLLSFLRSFFMEDYRLVELLLDPSIELHSAINQIGKRLQLHMNEFFTALDQRTDTFEKAFASQGPTLLATLPDPTWIEGLCPDSIQNGKRFLNHEVEQLRQRALQLNDLVAASDLLTILHRELIRLACVHIDVEVSQHVAMCKGDDGTMLAMFQVSDTQDLPCQAKGRMMLYFAPYRNYLILAVSMENRVIALQFLRKAEEDITSHFEKIIKNVVVIEDTETAFAKACDKICETSELNRVREQITDEIKRQIVNIYKYQALLFTPDSAMPSVIEALSAGGIGTLLSDDLSLARFYCYVSVLSSLGGPRDYIKDACIRKGMEFESLMKRVKQRESQGVPLVVDIPPRNLTMPYF